MSYVLGIDTSSVELGIGLVKDDKPVMAVSRYSHNSHAEHIAQCVAFILSANKISALEIRTAAIAVGPGSFTGLRIGIAFIKGFFFGREARVLPLSSLESMAGTWHASGRNVVGAYDARNNEVFWARFRIENNGITRKTADILDTLDNFKSSIAGDDIVLTDNLGYTKSVAFDFLSARPEAYAVEKDPVSRGLSCALIGASRLRGTEGWIKPADINPHYMNTSSAEKRLAHAC
jgi:tRNA threonylcarbamoyladenosine biosynthesis protein TsaB